MWGRGGRQVLVVVLLVSILMTTVIITKTPKYRSGSVTFSEEQIQFLKKFAEGGHDAPPTDTPGSAGVGQQVLEDKPVQQIGPKERSEALKKSVRDSCEMLNMSIPVTGFTMSHMHYDDARKAIYCFIPKVACTSWKRVWMKMTGRVTPDRDLASIGRYAVHVSLPVLSGSMDKERKLKTYKKFLIIRHPFDRVLSAYKDKLEHTDKASAYDFHREIGQKIEKMYRGSAITQGHNVTFPDFIKFISRPGPGTFEQRNEHWLSMHELCNPCGVQYDFIGKYENMKEDAEYLLEWLGVKDIIGKFPASDRSFYTRRYDPKYFNQLGQKEKIAFFSKYMADFLAFDYKFL